MSHLFVIRHGHYFAAGGLPDEKKALSDIGREQITQIAEEMKAIIGEVSNGYYLLSSPALRAEPYIPCYTPRRLKGGERSVVRSVAE